MASRNDLQAAVLNGGWSDRKPDRQDMGSVRLRQDHPVVLMPGCLRYQRAIPYSLLQRPRGRLDPDMMNRVDIDLGADDVFNDIQHARMREKIEDCRADMQREVV